MSVELGGKLIDVFIVKKNNKNMYLRVKEYSNNFNKIK